MKILHLSNTISIKGGGIASVVKNITRQQTNMGHDVHIWLVTSFKSKSCQQSRKLKGEVIVNVREVSAVELMFAILKSMLGLNSDLVMKLNSFDVIHRHGLWSFVSFFGWLVDVDNNNYFLSPHGLLNQEALSRSVLRKKVFLFFVELISLSNTAALVVSSKHEMLELQNLSKFKNKKIRVVPNGVEDVFFSHNKKNNINEVDSPCCKFKKQFLYLGAIERVKGIDVFLAAIKGISHKLREADWTVLCVGDGDKIYKKELTSYINKHDLVDLVHFHEGIYGDERIATYLESRFFVSLSHSENFGITIAESLSLGVPVLVSSKLPWKDVSDTKAGIVVEPNLISIQEGLLLASSVTDEEYEEYSRNASKYSHDRFKWDSINSLLLKVYAEFVNVTKTIKGY